MSDDDKTAEEAPLTKADIPELVKAVVAAMSPQPGELFKNKEYCALPEQ